MDEETYTWVRSEFLRRAKFQVDLSKALDRAIANPSKNPQVQKALVDTLIYCLNEVDIAFADPAGEFPGFSEKAYKAAQKHTIVDSKRS